jgi:hypothetical protein
MRNVPAGKRICVRCEKGKRTATVAGRQGSAFRKGERVLMQPYIKLSYTRMQDRRRIEREVCPDLPLSALGEQ